MYLMLHLRLSKHQQRPLMLHWRSLMDCPVYLLQQQLRLHHNCYLLAAFALEGLVEWPPLHYSHPVGIFCSGYLAIRTIAQPLLGRPCI